MPRQQFMKLKQLSALSGNEAVPSHVAVTICCTASGYVSLHMVTCCLQSSRQQRGPAASRRPPTASGMTTMRLSHRLRTLSCSASAAPGKAATAIRPYCCSVVCLTHVAALCWHMQLSGSCPISWLDWCLALRLHVRCPRPLACLKVCRLAEWLQFISLHLAEWLKRQTESQAAHCLMVLHPS